MGLALGDAALGEAWAGAARPLLLEREREGVAAFFSFSAEAGAAALAGEALDRVEAAGSLAGMEGSIWKYMIITTPRMMSAIPISRS